MAPIALGAEHRQLEHLQHAGIAFVEIEGNDLGIPIDTQRELRQVVGADREPVEQFRKRINLNDIVRDLAHDVYLKAVLPALETVAGHGIEDALRLLHAPAERHHDADIRQAHVFAHAPQRGTLERETGGIGRVRVAGGAAETEHWIFLFGLEALATQEPRVFIGLEVRKPDNHGLGIERRPDHADAFGKLLDEVVRRLRIVAHELLDFLARLGRDDLFRADQRHRVHLDVLADDEFHPRQPDAVVGKHRGPECQFGIAEVQHDLGARAFDLAQFNMRDLDRKRALIDATDLTLRAANRHRRAGLQRLLCISRPDDGRDAELARDNGRMAGPPAALGHDTGGDLHHRLPIGRRRVPRPEPRRA